MGCTWEVPVRWQDKPFPGVWSDPRAGHGGESLSLETLAQGGAGHGAAMGGMCTHTPLHPLVPEVTPEDGTEGRCMGLDTWMAPAVPVGHGRDAWSEGEQAARENCILSADF